MPKTTKTFTAASRLKSDPALQESLKKMPTRPASVGTHNSPQSAEDLIKTLENLAGVMEGLFYTAFEITQALKRNDAATDKKLSAKLAAVISRMEVSADSFGMDIHQ